MGTVRLLWVCPFSRPECGRGSAATKVDQRTLGYMIVVLAVVVSSVLLLWLLLVLVVVVAVAVVVVVGRSMLSLQGGLAVRTAGLHAGHRPRELASGQPV